MSILRFLQGERSGMGSELGQLGDIGELLAAVSLSPSIAIQNDVLLVDVSYYQKWIDWPKMVSAGVAGAIIRAGQRTWVDERFKENWVNARAAGMPRGSYWFYDSREDLKRQAALWWAQIREDPGELVHVADLEEAYGGPYFKPEHMRAFVEEFQRLSGLPDERIAIYTGYYWWLARVGPDTWWKRYPLWLAWYADMSVVRVPGPWATDDLLFWQWTSSANGPYYGVQSQEIDMDWYCCSLSDFNQRFHLSPSTGGTMPKYEAIAIGDNTRLRENHGTQYPYTGSYPRGTRFHGDFVWICPENIYDSQGLLLQKQGDQWLQVLDVNGVPKTGWVAIIHKAGQICTITPPVETTPTPLPMYADVSYSVTLGDGVNYETVTLTGILRAKK